MAIIKHIASKSASYQATIDYMEHQHDKDGKTLLDANNEPVDRFYMCSTINVASKDTFVDECNAANEFYNQNQKRGDVKQHQYIISFSAEEVEKDNITPEKAMEIAEKWTKDNLDGHQAILYLHEDGSHGSGNMHVHININSVRIAEIEQKEFMKGKKHYFEEGKKHSCTADFRKNMRLSLDKILEEERMTSRMTERSGKRVNDKEYHVMEREQRKGTAYKTKKEELRECIEQCAFINNLSSGFNKEGFISSMKNIHNIDVTEKRGRFSYHSADWDRSKSITDRSLGDDYRLENLPRLAEQHRKAIEESHKRHEENLKSTEERLLKDEPRENITDLWKRAYEASRDVTKPYITLEECERLENYINSDDYDKEFYKPLRDQRADNNKIIEACNRCQDLDKQISNCEHNIFLLENSISDEKMEINEYNKAIFFKNKTAIREHEAKIKQYENQIAKFEAEIKEIKSDPFYQNYDEVMHEGEKARARNRDISDKFNELSNQESRIKKYLNEIRAVGPEQAQESLKTASKKTHRVINSHGLHL